MDSETSIQIFSLIILIAFSAFFSSSETALTSINKIKLRHLKESGNKKALLVEKLLENPKDLIGSILIGNNIVNIGASAIATVLTTRLVIDTPYESSGVAIATGVMTIFVLIFGEITPKSFAQQYSEQISLLIARPISIIVFMLKPFSFIFSKISSVFIKLFGGNPDKIDPFITEEELRTLVDVSEEEGIIEENEKDMLFNVFDFGDQQVKDIMVQRVDIISIASTVTYRELLNSIREYQFSRVPIYENNLDNIIGILNVKDLILLDDYNKKNFDVKNILRDASYTFEFKKIIDLFSEMKLSRCHISIVLDEYGGTAGLVTIEDIIEEIFGEIDDEYDDLTEYIKKVSENEYIVCGNTKINLINEELNLFINSEKFESIGGYIIESLDRIPLEGEIVDCENFSITVKTLNKNSIKKIKLTLQKIEVA